MVRRTNPYIAVIGGGSCSAAEAGLAEEVGGAIAESGAVLVCGGLGGVMEAAGRGAKAKGGTTIGIIPGSDYHAANDYIDYVICSGIGEARNLAVVLTADGVIALPGEYGTLSEISFALKYNRPVASLGSWEVSERISRVHSAPEAVAMILKEVG
jgi:uncharacterized protein (TIGR00725 family)